MSDLERVLILGTGPTSIQLAVILKTRMNCVVGVAGRKSVRSDAFFSELARNNRMIRVDVQNERHQKMSGECVVDHVFQGYGAVTGEWDILILSVTADAYTKVLNQIDDRLLRRVRCIISVSPTLGSNSLIRNYMNRRDVDPEVISFSTYFGGTRWMSGGPSNHALTAGVKERVYIGSTRSPSKNVDALCELYEQLGIVLEIMDSPMAAETRNISLYVHPPLFMNRFSLDAIFGESKPRRYVYKLFPEGPITPSLIRDMLAHWKEITQLVEKMGITGINLLKLMSDDTYPVRPESISRHDIEGFERLSALHQEYLLYVRYASLLVDPFSQPDENGRYFDFSAVPIPGLFLDGEGYWDVPRMPKEDYYRTKIIQGIARHVDSSCPTIDRFIATYEGTIERAAEVRKDERLSDAFIVQSFAEDLTMISGEIAGDAMREGTNERAHRAVDVVERIP